MVSRDRLLASLELLESMSLKYSACSEIDFGELTMHSLLMNNLKNNSSEETIKLSKEEQRQILGGGEETTIIFIGLKPPKLFPILSN